MSVDWDWRRRFESPRDQMGFFNDVPWQNIATYIITMYEYIYICFNFYTVICFVTFFAFFMFWFIFSDEINKQRSDAWKKARRRPNSFSQFIDHCSFAPNVKVIHLLFGTLKVISFVIWDSQIQIIVKIQPNSFNKSCRQSFIGPTTLLLNGSTLPKY